MDRANRRQRPNTRGHCPPKMMDFIIFGMGGKPRWAGLGPRYKSIDTLHREAAKCGPKRTPVRYDRENARRRARMRPSHPWAG